LLKPIDICITMCYTKLYCKKEVIMTKISKSIRFDEETIEQLNKIGIKLDRKFSWLVNRAVQEFIKKNK